MVDIYSRFELWEEAYEYLLIQASTTWISLHQVQNIVNNLGYYYRLESTVEDRLRSDNLSEEDREEFLKIQKWLESK